MRRMVSFSNVAALKTNIQELNKDEDDDIFTSTQRQYTSKQSG